MFDPEIQEIFSKIKERNKVFLARAITWAESSNETSRRKILELLDHLGDFRSNAIRIGVTGPPGVGKSTMIESLGLELIQKGYSVAVLAVDPSSSESHGSILGDKTRMTKLSSHPSAYVRPSPSGLELGGVNQASRESILICEAAGYDFIFVETVGVGQSEIEVKEMTDIFLLLLNPGGGDELQGIKKGIMEAADIIAITKYDSHLTKAGEEAFSHVKASLQVMKNYRLELPDVLNVSSVTSHNTERLLKIIESKTAAQKQTGEWDVKRKNQERVWFRRGLLRRLNELIENDPTTLTILDNYEKKTNNATRPVPIDIEKHLEKLKERFGLD